MSKQTDKAKKAKKAAAHRFDKAVGARIRKEREGVLSQEALGEKIDASGAQVSRYEKGETTCEPYTLALIAKVLNCPVGDFLDGIEV